MKPRGRSCDVCGGPNRSPRATTCAACRRRLLELEGADPAQLSLPIAPAPRCACGGELIASVNRSRGKCDRCILHATIEASGIGALSIVYPDGQERSIWPPGASK